VCSVDVYRIARVVCDTGATTDMKIRGISRAMTRRGVLVCRVDTASVSDTTTVLDDDESRNMHKYSRW